jgi:hypothetical protein
MKLDRKSEKLGAGAASRYGCGSATLILKHVFMLNIGFEAGAVRARAAVLYSSSST